MVRAASERSAPPCDQRLQPNCERTSSSPSRIRLTLAALVGFRRRIRRPASMPGETGTGQTSQHLPWGAGGI